MGGFNPFSKSSWEKEFGKDGSKISAPFEKAAKELRSVGDGIKRELQKVERDVKKEGSNIYGMAGDLSRQIEKTAEKAGSEIQKKAEEAGGQVEETFEKRIPELITEKLPEALEQLAKEAAKDSVKKALNVALDVIEMMEPTSYTLVFGVELALVVQGEVTISASIPNPLAKLTEIRKWAKNPPKGRAQIISCIKDFGPSSISGEFKISGNGGSAEWDGDDKYARIDAFLKNRGV